MHALQTVSWKSEMKEIEHVHDRCGKVSLQPDKAEVDSFFSHPLTIPGGAEIVELEYHTSPSIEETMMPSVRCIVF